MKRRRYLLTIALLMLVGGALAGVPVIRDELALRRVKVGMSVDQVIAILGQPTVREAYRGGDPLFEAPPACTVPDAVWVYFRGNFRDSILVYLDHAQRVVCIQRRGITRYS